jgi:hypothetical protein
LNFIVFALFFIGFCLFVSEKVCTFAAQKLKVCTQCEIYDILTNDKDILTKNIKHYESEHHLQPQAHGHTEGRERPSGNRGQFAGQAKAHRNRGQRAVGELEERVRSRTSRLQEHE